jgi:hypothetical protein
MDWATHDHRASGNASAPQLELVGVPYWRVRSQRQRLVECALYRTGAGLELRCGFSLDDPLFTQMVRNEAIGAMLAVDWKNAILSTGKFTEAEPA